MVDWKKVIWFVYRSAEGKLRAMGRELTVVANWPHRL